MIRNVRMPLAIAAVVSLSWLSAAAQTAKPTAPPDPNAQKVTVSATIEAIDRASRLITLKGPKGNIATVYADQSIKRFDELKVGDTVSATYYESLAVNVRKPGDPAPPATSSAVTPSKGAPGATAAVQETATVTVQAIDKANQSVTVKRQDGGVVSFRVQQPKYLEMAKVGDTVDITYTRALLLEVAPGK
jgi:hypothetical protein